MRTTAGQELGSQGLDLVRVIEIVMHFMMIKIQ
jgi:hypothetical protein